MASIDHEPGHVVNSNDERRACSRFNPAAPCSRQAVSSQLRHSEVRRLNCTGHAVNTPSGVVSVLAFTCQPAGVPWKLPRRQVEQHLLSSCLAAGQGEAY